MSWDETGYGAPETQHAPVVHAMSHSVFNGVLNVFIYGNDGYIHHIWQTTCDKVPNPWGWCTWSIWYKISNKIPESVSSNNPLSIGTNIHLGIEVWGCVWVAVVDPGERPGSLPPLFLDQTEARKFFFKTGPPSYLRVWMTAPPPPPPLIWKSGSATGLILYKHNVI